MEKKKVGAIAIKSFALLVVLVTSYRAFSQDAKTPYPIMAPIKQLLWDFRPPGVLSPEVLGEGRRECLLPFF
jgi:hypothetical protein